MFLHVINIAFKKNLRTFWITNLFLFREGFRFKKVSTLKVLSKKIPLNL